MMQIQGMAQSMSITIVDKIESGCVMFCLQEAIHNTFRKNESFDDLGDTISPSENPDALIEENVFYVRKGVPFVRKNMDSGKYELVNNKIFELD